MREKRTEVQEWSNKQGTGVRGIVKLRIDENGNELCLEIRGMKTEMRAYLYPKKRGSKMKRRKDKSSMKKTKIERDT